MIKGIEKFFLKKAKNLGIKLDKKLRIGSSFLYSGLLKEKKVIFKLRRIWRHRYKEKLKTEILTGEVLNEKKMATDLFQFRHIILYSISYPQWSVSGYREGEKALGKKCRHWCFSEEFYKIISPQKMFDILNFWQERITDFVSLNKHKFLYNFKRYYFLQDYKDFKKDSYFYLKQHLKNNINLRKVFNESDEKIGGMILKKFKNIIESNNKYICHGDMHPGNFLIYKNEVSIIDLEATHLDIPFVDFVFVWSACWNNIKWRKKVMELFLKNGKNKEMFNIFFNLNIVRFTPHFLINIKIIPGNEKNLNKALGILRDDYKNAAKFLLKVNIERHNI